MGLITIKGLRLIAYHGVLEQERRVGNEFMLDIMLDVPGADLAMTTDSLSDTINYAEVVDLVKREMVVPSLLLEHAVGRIHAAIIRKYGDTVPHGEITLAKLAPPIAAQLSYVAFTYKW